MATTTTPEVKTKTAPISLTANAVVKVKEIMGQQNPVPAGLRVSVVGTTTSVVFQRIGAAANLNGAWAAASANLTPFAGQTIRLLIEAADAGTASLVEAGIDDVRITQQ